MKALKHISTMIDAHFCAFSSIINQRVGSEVKKLDIVLKYRGLIDFELTTGVLMVNSIFDLVGF